MPAIEHLQQLIIEAVKNTKDADLLDLVHKLLLSES